MWSKYLLQRYFGGFLECLCHRDVCTSHESVVFNPHEFHPLKQILCQTEALFQCDNPTLSQRLMPSWGFHWLPSTLVQVFDHHQEYLELNLYLACGLCIAEKTIFMNFIFGIGRNRCDCMFLYVQQTCPLVPLKMASLLFCP